MAVDVHSPEYQEAIRFGAGLARVASFDRSYGAPEGFRKEDHRRARLVEAAGVPEFDPGRIDAAAAAEARAAAAAWAETPEARRLRETDPAGCRRKQTLVLVEAAARAAARREQESPTVSRIIYPPGVDASRPAPASPVASGPPPAPLPDPDGAAAAPTRPAAPLRVRFELRHFGEIAADFDAAVLGGPVDPDLAGATDDPSDPAHCPPVLLLYSRPDAPATVRPSRSAGEFAVMIPGDPWVYAASYGGEFRDPEGRLVLLLAVSRRVLVGDPTA